MLSFYEMNCLLEKKRRKTIREAITDDEQRRAALAARAEKVRALKAKSGLSVAPAPTQPAELEPIAPDVNAGVTGKAAVKPTTPALSADMLDKIARAKQGAEAGPAVQPPIKGVGKPDSYDVNDPAHKVYTKRSSGGVMGNTTNLSGLEAGMGSVGKGGGSVSRQMSDVATSDKKQAIRARLMDKLAQLNGIIKQWPTMAFLVNCAMAKFGIGPLKHLGEDALHKFATDKSRTLDSDRQLTKPFALVLKKGAGGAQQYDRQNIATNAEQDVPEVEIADEKTMAKVLMQSWEFWQRKDELEALAPNGEDPANKSPRLGGGTGPRGTGGPEGGEGEDDYARRVMAQKAAARQAKRGGAPKTEAQGWMDMVNLMEHWGF